MNLREFHLLHMSARKHFSIMKIVHLLLILSNLILSDTLKIYLYTPSLNTNNFKSIKVNFDAYLSAYGDYELQPFNERETFEDYVKKGNAVVLLSSWHYYEIANKYHLQAQLVAQKNGHITDKMLLIGQHETPLKGIVTSAYNNTFTKEMLNSIAHATKLSVLRVPKEIDALMSVGFGMSKFALVSQESFFLLQTINPALTQDMNIYFESKPQYRMFLATNDMNKDTENLITIFKEMDQSEDGRRILNMIGMDKLLPFEPSSHDEKELKK